ncbi:MAG: sugar-binding domain-containing protein [Candidatus Promineifilaceae bacterium]
MVKDYSKQILFYVLVFCLVSLVAGCGQEMAATDTPSSMILPTDVTMDIRQPLLPESHPRGTTLLNGQWQFSPDPGEIGLTNNWAEVQYDDSTWESVEVPHSWNPMPGHSDFSGIAWYRGRFELPGEAKDALLRIRFEAVFYKAQVWLNSSA